MTEFCYTTYADKRRRYPAETIPAILREAMRGANVLEERQALVAWMRAHNVTSAESLHNAARAGLYRSSARPHCDPIQPVSVTIERGGDCDQWACVVMAGLLVLGFTRVWLVTEGDNDDPFRHAAVEFYAASRQWVSDPKFDQAGVPFNVRAHEFPVRQHWRLA